MRADVLVEAITVMYRPQQYCLEFAIINDENQHETLGDNDEDHAEKENENDSTKRQQPMMMQGSILFAANSGCKDPSLLDASTPRHHITILL